MSAMYETVDRLCKDRGMNVTAMCRELQITRSALSELKAGRTRNLSSEYTAKIASYFSVSVEWLLGRTNQPDGMNRDELPLEIRMVSRKIGKLPEKKQKDVCKMVESIVDQVLDLIRTENEK